jgi:hypothetical protein
VLVLIVFVWVAIFGGVGALLARSREVSTVTGLALGVVLGPFGWAITWWVTRPSRRPVSAAQWLGETFDRRSGGAVVQDEPPAYEQPASTRGASGGHYF